MRGSARRPARTVPSVTAYFLASLGGRRLPESTG
jgi:hypothetical protein